MKQLKNIKNVDDLWEKMIKKKCFCFGAGRQLTEICDDIPILSEHIKGIIDNNTALHNTLREIKGRKIPIFPVDSLLTNNPDTIILLITSCYKNEMIEQLEHIEGLENLEYIDFLEMFDTMAWSGDCPPESFKKNKIEMIPKKIHFCWFSGKKIPPRLQGYVDGWKKLCPDYEIILWDESNYNISKNEYMKTAYENKMWSFVSDYARLDIIHEHGGIYMDTDVEMVKRPDELLFNDAYIGFERLSTVNTGSGFGAKPGFPIIKEMMEFYNGLNFVNEADPNQMVLCPIHETAILKKHGLKLDGNFQIVDDMSVYPVMYFNAKSLYSNQMKVTEKTISIHHCTWTWAGEKSKL